MYTYMIKKISSKGMNNIKFRTEVSSGGGHWIWPGRGTHKFQRH